MKKIEAIIILSILTVALLLRLYQIDRPLADWHSWRQADTAAVARNFLKEGFNPLIPKFDDMSKQANGLDNPNRYRFVEFPIYNTLVALVWKFTGTEVIFARLTTALISLFSCFFIFLIVKKYSSLLTASLAAFFFGTIPYNVFYSTTILPGPFMVMCTLALYYFFIKFLEEEKTLFLIASASFANMALLSWPVAAFFFLPIFYLSLEKYKLGILKSFKLWTFAILSILPTVVWRIWMLNFPQGIPNWRFLINEGNIRFKGAYFRWIFAERLGNLILSFGGIGLFVLGIITKTGKEKLFYFSILLSSIIYLIIFASGNVRHDYYQVPIIPVISIFLAKGTASVFEMKTVFINRYALASLVIFMFLLMYAFGFYQVRGFYWINKPQILEAGKAVDRLLPKDAKIIAPYGGDTAFLYQTNRWGYPITDRPLVDYVKNGVEYLVSVEPEENGIKNLAQNCNVIDSSDEYVIIKLDENCLSK